MVEDLKYNRLFDFIFITGLNVGCEHSVLAELKHECEGIGISSVKAVIEKYGESAQFETDGNEFRSTIILCV